MLRFSGFPFLAMEIVSRKSEVRRGRRRTNRDLVMGEGGKEIRYFDEIGGMVEIGQVYCNGPDSGRLVLLLKDP
jgi:hypothetical protein